MLTKIVARKLGCYLGQEEVRGQHRISLSNVANEGAYLLIQLVFLIHHIKAKYELLVQTL